MDDEIDKELVKRISDKLNEIYGRVEKDPPPKYTISHKLRMAAFDVYGDLYDMKESLTSMIGMFELGIDDDMEKLLLKIYDENEDEICKMLNVKEGTRNIARGNKEMRLRFAEYAVEEAARQIVNNAKTLM